MNSTKSAQNIFNSNKHALIFNSAIYHSVMPPSKDGSFRVIFNFCSENQLIQFKNSKKIALAFDQKT